MPMFFDAVAVAFAVDVAVAVADADTAFHNLLQELLREPDPRKPD